MRIALAALAFSLAAPGAAQTIVAAPPHTSSVDGFIVTEGDISDRPYDVIGSISVKAGKATWVSHNPDREKIDSKLRAKGRAMGADAVVRVQYGSTGVSAMSWGGMRGEGVAIRFKRGGG